jgi:hypothetical protein
MLCLSLSPSAYQNQLVRRHGEPEKRQKEAEGVKQPSKKKMKTISLIWNGRPRKGTHKENGGGVQ